MPPEREDLNAKTLWRRHRSQSNQDTRSSLIDHYSPFNKKIAASIYSRRTDDEVEFEEYVQMGLVGLIESIDRYQPDKGASFETFARYRIRGAIFNGMEKMSERREQYAYRAKLRRERLKSISADENSDNEPDLFEEMKEIALGLAISFMLEGTGMIQSENHNSVNQLYQAKEMAQLRESLLKSIDQLPEREQFILQEHYFQYTSFTEIASNLGITKGRVSQIHKRALQSLRHALARSQSLDGYY